MNYLSMSKDQQKEEMRLVLEKYNKIKESGLSYDMSRGKPEVKQLDLGMSMLSCLQSPEDCKTRDGFDVRNYGLPNGLPECKAIFSQLLEVEESEVFIGGNSSLKLMYNLLVDAMLIGFPGCTPWSKQNKIRFLCPAPGYDRHFTMCEHLGIEMITIPMLSTGPDMDLVEKLVSCDETIKGIWCVPKYSNPTGITFSDETVRRFAGLKPKAPDFKIFWDNAYMVHDFYDEGDKLLNLIEEAKKAGNEDIVFEFFSTSKITFAGAGICVVAASEKNIRWITECFALEGLGYDKINQLRHTRYLKDVKTLKEIMKKHAAIIRPKFEAVSEAFSSFFGDSGIASWLMPNGGYFISLDVMDGTATRTWTLAKEAGITLTPVGATFPYRQDPNDRNLRIAPSNVELESIPAIAEYITVCAKLAALEKLMGINS